MPKKKTSLAFANALLCTSYDQGTADTGPTVACGDRHNILCTPPRYFSFHSERNKKCVSCPPPNLCHVILFVTTSHDETHITGRAYQKIEICLVKLLPCRVHLIQCTPYARFIIIRQYFLCFFLLFFSFVVAHKWRSWFVTEEIFRSPKIETPKWIPNRRLEK